MDVNELAEICHMRNRAYCRSIGDKTQVDWCLAPEWQKQSAISGVQFQLDNPDATPENQHESWMKEKEDDGWAYGPIKISSEKKHPCIRPYDELPEDQKKKDRLFIDCINEHRSKMDTVKKAVENTPEVTNGNGNTCQCEVDDEPLVNEGYKPPVDIIDDENEPETTEDPEQPPEG